MKLSKYSGNIKKQSVSGKHLSTRLNINSKYSSNDLISWQFKKIKFKKNSNILDLGCGSGAQAEFLVNKIGEKNKIYCVDLSGKSIGILKKKIPNNKVITFIKDMDDLKEFFNKKIDIFHSSYSLYYSSKPKKILDHCYKLLNTGGKFIITVPSYPHTMVEDVNSIKKVPKNVDESLRFYNVFLKSYIYSKFKKIKIYNFKNTLNIPSIDDYLNMYKATTYYDNSILKELKKLIEYNISRKGLYKVNKNAKLIIASKT